MNTTIFIDESGTLPDPRDKVIIIAAVCSIAIENIDLLFKRVKKKKTTQESSGEIKYYNAGIKTKRYFFELLAREGIKICVLVVEKFGKKIADTPENYASLCMVLLSDMLIFAPQIKVLVFDRHFSTNKDILVFNTMIRKIVGNKVLIDHVNSKQNIRVNVADMVAGSILAKESGKDPQFYEMIKSQIVSYSKVNWGEAKKSFIKNKNLVEPM